MHRKTRAPSRHGPLWAPSFLGRACPARMQVSAQKRMPGRDPARVKTSYWTSPSDPGVALGTTPTGSASGTRGQSFQSRSSA